MTRSACDTGRSVSRKDRDSSPPGLLLLLLMCLAVVVPLPAHAACPDGTILADIPTTLSTPKTASDGAGGSYVVWLNTLGSSNYQIFALRVDLSGRVVSGWSAGGLQVTTQTVVAPEYNMCVDSNGRLVIVWSSNVGGVPKIFAQRISSGGTLEWGGGMSVFSTAYWEQRPVIAADEIGGCFIAAEVGPSTTTDIYVQRIDSAGTTWGTGGR